MADNVTSFPLDGGAGSGYGQTGGWPQGGSAAGVNSASTIGQYGTAQTGNMEMWLPIWSGEILNAYDQYNIFESLVTTRAITSGTTLRFPITGTVGHKAQWLAGEELEGSNTISDPQWFDITLDSRPMASYFELDDISLMLTQWEYRNELARQAGLSLANARDKQIASLIAQAAFMPSRSPAVSKGGNFADASFGTSADDLTSATNYDLEASATFNYLGHTGAGTTDTTRANAALLFLSYLERYMVRLQEIDGPTQGVYASVTPQTFQDIRALGIARTASSVTGANTTPNNMQPMFGGVAQAGGLGAGYGTGMNALSDTLEYMGVTIVKTNHMPTQTVKASSASPAAGVTFYAGEAEGSVASGELTVASDTGFQDVLTAPDRSVKFIDSDTVTGAMAKHQSEIITDLGDSKYDFDWCGYGDVGATTATGGPIDSMFPTKALIWQKDAVASLSLQGMKVDSIKDVRRNTQFTVASVMRGGGVLRPELCAAICGAEVGT